MSDTYFDKAMLTCTALAGGILGSGSTYSPTTRQFIKGTVKGAIAGNAFYVGAFGLYFFYDKAVDFVCK